MTAAAERRRQAEREARVARILDAALEIAVDDGIGAVTTTRLARDLGYTVGALYRYWPSIDALLAALHQRTAETFYAAFFEDLTRARARLWGPPERVALAELLLLPRLYARLADADPRRFELVGQLLTHRWAWIDADVIAQVEGVVLPRIAEIVAVVERGASAGPLSPGNPLTRLFAVWIAVHATLSLRPLAERHGALVDVDGILEETVRTHLRGWGASDAEIDAARQLADRALAA